jgi:undecaprenyl-diphosphatase
MNSIIIFVAKYFIFLSMLVAAIYWLRVPTKEKIALGWRVVVGGAIAEGLAQVAGHLYYDTRPFVSAHIVPLIAHAPDNGFPSDHALLASFLGFVVLLYSRRTGLVLLLIAVLIGWARVLAHIHHPIDIIGSFVFAALAVGLVQLGARLAKRWRPAK